MRLFLRVCACACVCGISFGRVALSPVRMASPQKDGTMA